MILSRLKELVTEPGLVKTPFVALSGWIAWSTVKGVLEGVVLIGTVIIVALHAATAVIRRFCRRRHTGQCDGCRMHGSFWCPKGIDEKD